jgi:hypothetical protein
MRIDHRPLRPSFSLIGSFIGLLLGTTALAVPSRALAHEEDEDDTAIGESSVLAQMPLSLAQESFPPAGAAYPEGVGVVGSRVIVSGPATFGTAGNGTPSQLTVFDKEDGALLAQIPVQGELTEFEHALSEIAVFKKRVYASSTQLGVLSWDFSKKAGTPAQVSVSTPFCSVTGPFPCHYEAQAGDAACSADIRPGLPPLPNGIDVDSQGDIYVTDSLQGIVWHIDGGATQPAVARPLVCSRALQGAGEEGLSLFGANGVAVVGDDLYIGVTFGPLDAHFVPTSSIYRFPKEGGTAADLELVYSFAPVEVAPGVYVPPIADGLAYDRDTEQLYVVLGGQNAVAELDLAGDTVVEVARFTRESGPLPFLNPSTLALDEDGRAFVTNHAITACLPGSPDPTCARFDAAAHFGVLRLQLP